MHRERERERERERGREGERERERITLFSPFFLWVCYEVNIKTIKWINNENDPNFLYNKSRENERNALQIAFHYILLFTDSLCVTLIIKFLIRGMNIVVIQSVAMHWVREIYLIDIHCMTVCLFVDSNIRLCIISANGRSLNLIRKIVKPLNPTNIIWKQYISPKICKKWIKPKMSATLLGFYSNWHLIIECFKR